MPRRALRGHVPRTRGGGARGNAFHELFEMECPHWVKCDAGELQDAVWDKRPPAGQFLLSYLGRELKAELRTGK